MDDLEARVKQEIERAQSNPIIRAIVEYSGSDADRKLEVLDPYNEQVTTKYLDTGLVLLNQLKGPEFTRNFIEVILSKHFSELNSDLLYVHLTDPGKMMGGISDILFRQYIGEMLHVENIDAIIGENLLVPDFKYLGGALFFGIEGIYQRIAEINSKFNRVITLNYVEKSKGKVVICMEINPDYSADLEEVFGSQEAYDMVVKGIVGITQAALKIPPKAVNKENDLASVSVSEIGENLYEFTVSWDDESTLVRSPRTLWQSGRRVLARKLDPEAYQRIIGSEVETAALVSDRERFIRAASGYLPEQLVGWLRDGREDELREGRETYLTMFFTDIVGSTHISANTSPEDYKKVMLLHKEAMTDVIRNYDPYLDKIIGDAFFGYFGVENYFGEAEETHEEYAIKCLKMLLEMEQITRGLNKELFPEIIDIPLRIRIGVSSGESWLQASGPPYRIEFTPTGKWVNNAKRLEELCPPIGVLTDEDTYDLVRRGGFDIGPPKPTIVKGFTRPQNLYNVMGLRAA